MPLMTEDQVEEVARALWVAAWARAHQGLPREVVTASWLHGGGTWEEASKEDQEGYRGYAMAAIAAYERVRR